MMCKSLILILLVNLLSAQAWSVDSYQINAAASATITEHSVSKYVVNNCTRAIFVPTKTAPEWTSFYTNPPACVTISLPGPCAGISTFGAACTDGALYVDNDGTTTYQTTPGNCTNAGSPTCDGGTDSLTKFWSAAQVVTGITSWSNGAANTTAIVALYPSDDSAAKYCDTMNYAGHTDWYLPARGEIDMITANSGSFSGFTPASHYWTSTESSNTNGTTNLSSRGKSVTTVKIRCMRKY